MMLAIVTGSRMRRGARRLLSSVLGSVAFVAVAVVGAGDAHATPEYPLVIDATFGTECPQLTRCLICHTTARGGQSTAIQPFARTLGRYGLNRGRDSGALQAALAALPETTDSDNDGDPDVQELMLCGNPSGEDLGSGPQYGCDGAQLVPGSANDVGFGLVALLAASLIARWRGSSRSERRNTRER
jgi:hypothetical protein